LIPLKDNQPTSSFPIVTILLIAANVVVFLGQQVPELHLTELYALVPAEITEGLTRRRIPIYETLDAFGTVHEHYGLVKAVQPTWITIFTSMFLHASWLHIGGNMLYLWIFGNNIEDALGKIRFIGFYFLSGLVAAAAQILMDPASHVPMLGASGAIAGVLGAYYILYPSAKVLSFVPPFIFFRFWVRAWFVLGLWFMLQVINVSAGQQAGGGVAVFAHIGGFIGGVVMVNLLGGQTLAIRQRRRAGPYTPYGPYGSR